MKHLIWLDDIRDPILFIKGNISNYDIHWVKNYNEFVSKYDSLKIIPDLEISLDHDLGEELTGYDCVKYVVNDCMERNAPLPLINVHSSNPVGRTNIIMYINNYKKKIQNQYDKQT